MTITNNAQHNIAFKVKTTAPKFYCVRPNAAVVAPGESVEVQVIFLGLSEEPTSSYNCRDKFLVITLPAPEDLEVKDVSSAWSQLETEHSDEAISKKIKVKYLIEEEQHEIHDDKKSLEAQETIVGSSGSESKQIQKENEAKENTPLAPQETVENKPTATAETKVVAESKTDGSLNLKLLLLVIVLGFIIRWFYN